MSRLPSAPGVSTGIPPPKSRLARQRSLDLRHRKMQDQAPPPLPPLKSSKSTRASLRSRASLSSYEEAESPSTLSRYSLSSIGSTQTALTTPRSSLTSTKPPTKRLSSAKPASLPMPQQQYQPTQQVPLRITETPTPMSLRVGERVAVDSLGIVGTLKFLGTTQFKVGTWAGIQLDIIGTGKNDGSVAGIRYFQCPPQTGLFILASKVTSLDRDSDSVRSSSPISPQQPRPRSGASNRASMSSISSGSRAARYIGMTASQLTQRQVSTKKATRTPSMQPVPTHPTIPPVRQSHPSYMEPPSPYRSQGSTTSLPGGIPSPAVTPTSNSVHDTDVDDYCSQELLLNGHTNDGANQPMLTDTPQPMNLVTSKSSVPLLGSEGSPDPAQLQQDIGQAIANAQDATTLRVHQLRLRVEMLEAENKYLQLKNAENTTAEQILERSIVLRKKRTKGEGEADDEEEVEYFTLEGHKAIVQEIKQEHANAQKKWESDSEDLRTSVQQLESRVKELEAEQANLIKERDDLLQQFNDMQSQKAQMERKLHEYEEKIAIAEANAAAAQASRAVSTTTSNFYSENPEEMRERQMQMEMEMEEVHEKLASLMEAMRAKDMFLGTLSEQVETHRNAVEEKEREIRRTRADADRLMRDKERLREELNDLEKKYMEHQDCITRDDYEKMKREVTQAKDQLAKETHVVEEYRKRIEGLEQSVDELKRAGMESIELYESSVELHRVDMEAINARLMDERRKVSVLETEREDLRKAGLDAIEAYETTIEELKKEQNSTAEDHAFRHKEMQSTIDKLKQEIAQLVNASDHTEEVEKIKSVWESERQRLEEQMEANSQALTREREAQESLKQETEKLKEQLKETDKMTKEKLKLEERLQRLQADYDDQLTNRDKYLDDVRLAVENQKKTEGDLRRLTEAKEKADRELATALEALKRAETEMASLREQTPVDHDLLAKERQQHDKDMDILRHEIEKLEAEKVMLIKQKEQAELTAAQTAQEQAKTDTSEELASLQAENRRLTTENERLLESQKQAENECLKLMEEVEKLHSEGVLIQENSDLLNCATDDERIATLQQQLGDAKRQLERVLLKHTTETRQLTEKHAEDDRARQREIAALNRDVSELESLIESKIFKEADLEEALESERKQVKRLRNELGDIKEQLDELRRDRQVQQSLTSSSTSTTKSSQETMAGQPETKDETSGSTKESLYCEICEVSGHDLMSCKAVLTENQNVHASNEESRPYCENCEEYGFHTTQQCPNQNETY